MIARLRGTKAGLTSAGLVVDVGGVGYLVQVTPSVLRRPGDEVTVETYLHVREDALQLFGFGSAEERDLFVHLLSVNGVGPKVALAIVSGSTPAELRRAIALDDTARFEATFEKMRRGFARVAVRTMIGDELAAEGTILAIFQPKAKAP